MTFRLIAFTPEHPHPDEPERITDLLDRGFHCVHLRHPHLSESELEQILQAISNNYHPRIRIHDHFSLLEKFELAGVHLNSRNPICARRETSVTKSCHTLQELKDTDGYDYVTLSPVFPSISKPGYSSAENFLGIKDKLFGNRVIALGGVTAENMATLKESGYYGAAFLGDIWERNFSPAEFNNYIEKIIKTNN